MFDWVEVVGFFWVGGCVDIGCVSGGGGVWCMGGWVIGIWVFGGIGNVWEFGGIKFWIELKIINMNSIYFKKLFFKFIFILN